MKIPFIRNCRNSICFFVHCRIAIVFSVYKLIKKVKCFSHWISCHKVTYYMPGSSHILVTSFFGFSSLRLRGFLNDVFRLKVKMGKTKWKINKLLHNIHNQKPSYQNAMKRSIDIRKNLTKMKLCAAVPSQSSFIIFAWSMGKCVNKPFNSRIFFPSFQFDRFFLGLLIFFAYERLSVMACFIMLYKKKRYVLKSVVALVIEFCQFNSVLTNICYIAL